MNPDTHLSQLEEEPPKCESKCGHKIHVGSLVSNDNVDETVPRGSQIKTTPCPACEHCAGEVKHCPLHLQSIIITRFQSQDSMCILERRNLVMSEGQVCTL